MSAKKMILDAIDEFLASTKEEGWIYDPLDKLVESLSELRGFARNDAIRENAGKVHFLAPEGYASEVVEAPASAPMAAPAPVAVTEQAAPEPKVEKPKEEPKTEEPAAEEPVEAKTAAKSVAKKTASKAPSAPEENKE